MVDYCNRNTIGERAHSRAVARTEAQHELWLQHLHHLDKSGLSSRPCSGGRLLATLRQELLNEVEIGNLLPEVSTLLTVEKTSR
ncbi:hypothetical protein WI98_18535 [Burkholderia vietnamiensis]|nr:hypothetical protein WI98_18535 [Burkholderia vietnamiensis]